MTATGKLYEAADLPYFTYSDKGKPIRHALLRGTERGLRRPRDPVRLGASPLRRGAAGKEAKRKRAGAGGTGRKFEVDGSKKFAIWISPRKPPAGPTGLVLEDHAFGGELVADAIGFLEIFGFAGCGAELDQALYFGVVDLAFPVVLSQVSGSCWSRPSSRPPLSS